MKYEMIVVGAGTSALTYLYAALKTQGPKTHSIAEAEKAFGKGKVPESVMAKLRGTLPASILVIGQSDLWAKAQEKNPGYRVGQTSDHVRTPNSSVPIGKESTFRTVSDYVAEVGSLKSDLEKGIQEIGGNIFFLNDQVTGIRRAGSEYAVKARNRAIAYECKKVVVASGAGPTTVPPPLKLENIKNKQLLIHKRSYEELIGATEYIYSDAPKTKKVLVYGGQPPMATHLAIRNGRNSLN